MSAITGIGERSTIVLRASTSWSRGTATRTRSAPASATFSICSIVASRLAVSVLVIVCTATGAPPPIGTPPTFIWRFEGTEPVYETGYGADPSPVTWQVTQTASAQGGPHGSRRPRRLARDQHQRVAHSAQAGQRTQ